MQKGFYSFQVDKTPERVFFNKNKTDYNYPNSTFELGKLMEGYIKRILSLEDNTRTLFSGNILEPGFYIAFVKI